MDGKFLTGGARVILVGDIGGTKTRVAAIARDLARDSMVVETYRSAEHAGFLEILQLFMERHRPEVEACCVGVAGPVQDNRCSATNLPWVVDGRDLARHLGIASASLLNDLEAVAYGIEVLQPDEIAELQAGEPGVQGNRAVIAAGTGLGEAGLFWDGAAHRPFGSEGGHADFAPGDELEIDLLRALLLEYERVSWERLVSGPGLENILRFLRSSERFDRVAESPAVLTELDKAGEGGQAALVSKYAASGESPLCALALDRFVKLYGAEAGNLALKMKATGGLYVGGGIAPKNLAKMQDGTFLAAFLAKGRMRPLLEKMPVRILLNDQTALLGTANCALRSAGS
ncbi:MAG: glucokinase [Thermoanaerobaculia bacterium]